MNIRVFKDSTIALSLSDIAANLCRLSKSIKVQIGESDFSISGAYVSNPKSYRKLNQQILEESIDDDYVLLFTEKPYDNNYFWDGDPTSKCIIISLFGWDYLTTLPRNNGAFYFICAMLARINGIGFSHDERNTGCLNDFWEDKAGIDTGMRCAFICEKCITHFKKSKSNALLKISEIKVLLDDLCEASRSGMDICEYWHQQKHINNFDVFLCHNTEDKDAVRLMNERLKVNNIRTWLDEEQLPPGRVWQDALEEQIEHIKTAAIIVGSSGIGPWQQIEVKAILQEFINRKCPVIPVILGDCTNVPQLPLFLKQFTWVDFRKQTPDPIYRLLWGVTGVKPKHIMGLSL